MGKDNGPKRKKQWEEFKEKFSARWPRLSQFLAQGSVPTALASCGVALKLFRGHQSGPAKYFSKVAACSIGGFLAGGKLPSYEFYLDNLMRNDDFDDLETWSGLKGFNYPWAQVRNLLEEKHPVAMNYLLYRHYIRTIDREKMTLKEWTIVEDCLIIAILLYILPTAVVMMAITSVLIDGDILNKNRFLKWCPKLPKMIISGTLGTMIGIDSYFNTCDCACRFLLYEPNGIVANTLTRNIKKKQKSEYVDADQVVHNLMKHLLADLNVPEKTKVAPPDPPKKRRKKPKKPRKPPPPDATDEPPPWFWFW